MTEIDSERCLGAFLLQYALQGNMLDVQGKICLKIEISFLQEDFNMVSKGLFVKLVAKPGKEADVEAFLNSGLALVNDEPLTVTWYAIKFDENTFGIFDTFDGDEGRDAHLNGKVAAALMANAAELLLEGPSIEKIDILAAKPAANDRAESSVA